MVASIEGHYSFRSGADDQERYFLPKRMATALAPLVRRPFAPYGSYTHTYYSYHMRELSTDPAIPEQSPGYMGRIEFSKRTDGPIAAYTMTRTMQGNVNFRNSAQPVSITAYNHKSRNDLLCTFADDEPYGCHYRVERHSCNPELADIYQGTDDGQLESLLAHRTEGSVLLTHMSILDAVQKLTVSATKPEQPILFDYMEYFSYLKHGHQLQYAGSIAAEFDGEPVKLSGYCQVGNGTLPVFYWVTDSGLLIYVRFGISFWVLCHTTDDRREI